MPAIIAILLRFFAIVAAEFLVYFYMYRSKHGRAAVYRSQYAWVLDVLAISSGTCIAAGALYALSHLHIFAVPINPLMFWGLFILGSSQVIMHVIKWGIRMFWDT